MLPTKFSFDVAQVTRTFPPSIGIPKHLARFGQWLDGKPWGSVGCFEFGTNWADRYFHGAELHYDKFAMFLELPEFSSVGLWLGDGDASDAPVILLEPYDQHEMIAPSLESFLARIALGDFSDDLPSCEFLHQQRGDHEVPDLRLALQAFLKEVTGAENLASLLPPKDWNRSDILRWINVQSDDRDQELSEHPAMQAIADILQPYHSKEKWGGGVTIDIGFAGDAFCATIVSSGLNIPLKEAIWLKQPLSALREEAAARKPGLGLWHSATLLLVLGDVLFRPYYEEPPAFQRLGASPGDFKADQMRSPYEPRRIPPWLLHMLA